MAHFVLLNENNIVEKILVFDNEYVCNNLPFPESEVYALPIIASIFNGVWKQTSYNDNFRGTYAGIGCTYNEVQDIFEYIEP